MNVNHFDIERDIPSVIAYARLSINKQTIKRGPSLQTRFGIDTQHQRSPLMEKHWSRDAVRGCWLALLQRLLFINKSRQLL